MLQAFIVVLREGFEAFLIVAIILAYLKKTGQPRMLPAVYWGIAASAVASTGLGLLLLQGANGPLWEGVFGVAAALMVTWLVVHMWRTAPHLKRDMEARMARATQDKPSAAALLGTFLFTTFMISREGMETVLLLLQIHEPRIVAGVTLGILAAAGLAFFWTRFSYLINLKLFFQVTAIFLLLFVGQILLYSFHEFTEAGLFPHSEALHVATEPFSPDGLYGKWISLGMVLICAVWLAGAWLAEKLPSKPVARNA